MVDPRRLRADSDSGFSLTELLIAMLIFSIFIAVILSSILGIARASNKAQVVAKTAGGVLSVFQRIDRQIRYADAINYAGAGASGARYIEWRTPAASSPTQATLCTQWRFDPNTKVVSVRTWADGAVPTNNWATGLTNVVDDGGVSYPFALSPAVDGQFKNQRLTLTIDAGNSPVSGASISSTFVARNSSIASESNTSVVTAGVSDTPVCQASGGVRP